MGTNKPIPNREKDYTMRGTKMIKVHFPNWQFWIFSLTVNLLVVAMQPRSILAQGAGDSSQIQAASNTQTASIAPKILSEINRVRTDPQAYAQWLEQQRQYYDGIWLKLPGEKPVRTNRGRKALEEAIAILKEQQPLPPLKSSEQAAAVATSELANFANAKNIQYFSYGRKTATGIVMDLVVDELFPDRRRRQSLLSPEAEDSGVVCQPDPRYAKVCAIAYSDSPASDSPNNTDVAVVKPEVAPTPKTPSEPPESQAPAATPTPPETEEPEVAEAEKPAEPEVTEPEVAEVEPPAEEKTEEVATAEAEKPAENAAQNPTEEKTEEVATATLPVPPEPQMPPTPSAPPANSQSKTEADSSEVDQAEIESEIEEIAQSERERTEEPAEPEEELEESETEVEPDEAESSWSDSEPEEVAINTTNIDFSEEGVLEEGDRVIADDGSLYDFYPIEGKAGDSFTINLESDDFDAFVALVDSNGKTIGENDDISQENSNSQIEITLPEDGVYNVIVNTYDEDGTGQYVLTVSP